MSSTDYVTQTAQVNVAPSATPRRDQTLNFDLTPSNRVASLTGIYRATLRAAGTCGASFIAAVGVRNYTATINQVGSRAQRRVERRRVRNDFTGRRRQSVRRESKTGLGRIQDREPQLLLLLLHGGNR